MILSNDLPEWVLVHKKKGQTIKQRDGFYYLYESKCIYDNEQKHKNYTQNIYLGRITKEDGLIPRKTTKSIEPEMYTSKICGHYELINSLCGDILERLNTEFKDYGNLIFTIASLRAIDKTPYSELEDAYNESYFSVFDKTLPMSKTSLSDFLYNLSKNKEKFKNYMKKDIEKDDTLIFDGTNLLCGSQNISYSGVGYKHGHNYSSQVNLLYAYSKTKKKMVYYKLLEGSVSDSKSLPDIINEMEIKNGIAILDNGFVSDDNMESLLISKTKYILALRRDSIYVTKEILDDSARINAKEKFTNEHESIFAYEVLKKDNRICVYFNQTIASIETSEYLDKIAKKWEGFTEENFINAQKKFGMFVIKTNIKDKSLKEIYEYYKSRFEIEYIFDTLKNTLDYDTVYMHSDNSLEAWMFINHITITITQRIYDLLRRKEINLSLHSVFKKLRQVIKQRSILDKDELYIYQVIPSKTRKILEKLELI